MSDELIKLVLSLKSSNAQGCDVISINIGKKSHRNCIKVLLHVIRLSFSKGKFPEEMKIANVIPVHKNNNGMMFNNSLKISILLYFLNFSED